MKCELRGAPRGVPLFVWGLGLLGGICVIGDLWILYNTDIMDFV